MRMLVSLLMFLGMVMAGGCDASRSAGTGPDRAGSALSVNHADFDRLWAACEAVAREMHFTIDRRDYRGGVLSTEPMTGGQLFEPWRTELRTTDAVIESALQTTRRTLTFAIERRGDHFACVPTVRVEKLALTERRMTTSAVYGSAFRKTAAYGTRETDANIALPRSYWYEVSPTDVPLQAHVVERVSAKLSPR
jgi:hypothetical protein